jgi:phosphoglucosamine mutase
MIEAMAAAGARLSELVQGFEEYPQILTNVRVSHKTDFSEFPEIIDIIEAVKHRLGEGGRIDVRYSGTEPVARVMVEGRDRAEIEEIAGKVASTIAKYLGSDQKA